MTSGLETEWDYSGRKGRDGQKKKIGKANDRKGKVKKNKRSRSKWTRGKGGKGEGAPAPHGAEQHRWHSCYVEWPTQVSDILVMSAGQRVRLSQPSRRHRHRRTCDSTAPTQFLAYSGQTTPLCSSPMSLLSSSSSLLLTSLSPFLYENLNMYTDSNIGQRKSIMCHHWLKTLLGRIYHLNSYNNDTAEVRKRSLAVDLRLDGSE